MSNLFELRSSSLYVGSAPDASSFPLLPSYAASPIHSPRQRPNDPAFSLSPTESLATDLARRLAEVEAEAKRAELARRVNDVDAEALLVQQTKREVEEEFMRCRRTMERAYSSVLAPVRPAVG